MCDQVKEKLKSFRAAQRDVKRARETLIEMYSDLSGVGGGIVSIRTGVTKERDVIGAKLGNIEECVNDLLDKIVYKTEIQESVVAFIKLLDNEVEEEILIQLYTKSDMQEKPKRMTDIAEELGYSLRQVQRYYQSALKKLNKIMS